MGAALGMQDLPVGTDQAQRFWQPGLRVCPVLLGPSVQAWRPMEAAFCLGARSTDGRQALQRIDLREQRGPSLPPYFPDL